MNFWWASFSIRESSLPPPLVSDHPTPFLCFFPSNYTLEVPFPPSPAKTPSLWRTFSKPHLYHKISLNRIKGKWLFCSLGYILGCNRLEPPNRKDEIFKYVSIWMAFSYCISYQFELLSLLNCIVLSPSMWITLMQSLFKSLFTCWHVFLKYRMWWTQNYKLIRRSFILQYSSREFRMCSKPYTV